MTQRKDHALVFGQYLREQSKYLDSPFVKLFNTFSLSFILKNLNKVKKEEFLKLLLEEKFEEIPNFLAHNISGFAQRLKKTIQTELEKIEKQALNNQN